MEFKVGKQRKDPKKHIVSCRVNRREMELLKMAAAQSSLSISEIVRSCLEKPLMNWSHSGQEMATDLHS